MFLEQGVKPENKFWKYVLGLIIIILASLIGQIPLLIAVQFKSLADKKSFPENDAALMKLFDSNLTLFLMMLSFVFILIGVFFIVKYIHHQTILSVTTSRKKTDISRIIFSFSLWTFFTIISFLCVYINSPENYVYNFKPIPFIILFFVGSILIPLQTSAEEYVFRSYLMQGFANLSLNKWFPLIMTSILFGSMHWFNPEVTKMGNIIMIYYIGTGFFLGIITLMDEGIELALGFHAANNLIGALLVTSDWSVFQTHSIYIDISEPSAGFDVILPVAVIYPILLLIFSKKYNWKNWSEKLTGKIYIPNNKTTQFFNLK